jgi:hypothetical protein
MREVADPGDCGSSSATSREAAAARRRSTKADSDLRLRSSGDIQIAVGHKPSDPLSAGAADSQAVAIAKDLLHLADIKVLHGQDKGVADKLAQLIGLNPAAQQLVTGWAMSGKGLALWMVGDRQYQVQTVRTPLEEALTFTNQALAGA